MKKITYTYIVSIVAVGSFLVGVGLARAESIPGFMFSGTETRYAVGAEFTTTVSLVSDASHRVDTAEGTLSFDGLTCKSIELAAGVMAQSTPSCDHPAFLVGVPGGVDGSKPIFTVTLVGTKNGDATLGINEVDILASGLSISRTYGMGIYGIGAKVAPIVETTPAGATGGDTSTSTAGEVSTTTEETTASSTDVVAENTAAATSTTNNGLLATVGNALYGIPSASVIVLAVLAIALFVGLLYYRRIAPVREEI